MLIHKLFIYSIIFQFFFQSLFPISKQKSSSIVAFFSISWHLYFVIRGTRGFSFACESFILRSTKSTDGLTLQLLPTSFSVCTIVNSTLFATKNLPMVIAFYLHCFSKCGGLSFWGEDKQSTLVIYFSRQAYSSNDIEYISFQK